MQWILAKHLRDCSYYIIMTHEMGLCAQSTRSDLITKLNHEVNTLLLCYSNIIGMQLLYLRHSYLLLREDNAHLLTADFILTSYRCNDNQSFNLVWWVWECSNKLGSLRRYKNTGFIKTIDTAFIYIHSPHSQKCIHCMTLAHPFFHLRMLPVKYILLSLKISYRLFNTCLPYLL